MNIVIHFQSGDYDYTIIVKLNQTALVACL